MRDLEQFVRRLIERLLVEGTEGLLGLIRNTPAQELQSGVEELYFAVQRFDP